MNKIYKENKMSVNWFKKSLDDAFPQDQQMNISLELLF